MLNLDDEHAREVRRCPLLIELVGLFLLNAVVAGKVKALAVVGLEVGIGRRGAEAVEVVDEVIVKNDEREMRVGVFVEALGNENDGTDEHGAAPELCQHVALNADVADVLSVGRRLDRGNDFSECDS